MKKLVLFLLIISSTFKLTAQSPDYDDLKVLYASKEYEKLVRKGIGYTEKESTKKEVLPYMWVSKGLYKISKSDNTDEKYKDAYKDAINYLGKALKNAEKYDGQNYIDDHADFVEELRNDMFISISDDISMDEQVGYKKAFGNAMKYQKIMNSPVPINFIIGVCRFNTKDRSGASKAWRVAVDSLETIDNIDSWGAAEKSMLKIGVAHTVKAYKSINQDELATKLLGKMAQWFEGDSEWDDLYDNIVNGVE